jgi:hypothetical protein
MSVFEIYKEAINAGGYTVTSMTERIETVYACGKISKEERAELLDMVSDKGDHLDMDAIMAQLADLDTRLSAIEQSGVKVWVKGMVTAKGQTVLYDALKTGTNQYCRYDGSRESTSLKPCQIVGWVILDSLGGKITHKTVKTDDGVVIVEVTE